MRRVLLGGVVLAVLLSAGCDVDGGGPGSGPGPEAGGQPGATASKAPEVVRVAEPWQDGMPEYGINVYWENSPKDDDEVVRAKAVRILDYIVGLKANAVAFSFPIYTTGITSNVIKPGKATPSPERVGIAVEEAERRGLRTSVRPILNETVLLEQKKTAWRGMIEPASRSSWFSNYQKTILPYAKASADAHTFVIGTELNTLEGESRWTKLIAAVKKVFPGEVAYSANFDSFQTGDVDVPADAVGVDAYPKFGLDDDASVKRIAAKWTNWLKTHEIDGPPVLHEAGIAAQDGAYKVPGHWGSTTRALNLDVQVKWYEGLCKALRDGAAGGIYWWKIDFDADPEKADEDAKDRMTFVGRPVEDTIRKCFA